MRFAEEGARLVLVDRNSEQLHKAKKKITQKFSSSVSLFCFDISREGEVKECINNVVRNLGSIDVLFNNAGVLDELETIDAQNVENWNKVISVNLIGAMLLIKHCSKVMMEKGDGAIINTKRTHEMVLDQEFGVTVPYEICKYLTDSVNTYKNIERDCCIAVYELPFYDATVQKYKVQPGNLYEYRQDDECCGYWDLYVIHEDGSETVAKLKN